MQKVWKVILVLSITTNFVLGFILINKPDIEPDFSIYTERIDSLESVLSIIQQNRDSIRSSIDTVYIEIDKNNKNYEEIYDSILSNSVYDDYKFFTKYLRQNKERFNSINNP